MAQKLHKGRCISCPLVNVKNVNKYFLKSEESKKKQMQS
jgi:hypothetical protein